MAAGDSYRLVCNATWSNQLYQNTLALNMNGATTPVASDFLVVANAFKEIWRSQQRSTVLWTTWEATQLWGAQMTINQAKCTRSGGLAFAGVFTGTNTGGDPSSEVLPPQCAFVTTILTGFAGRRKRGRWYTFGLTESLQADGLWTAAFINTMGTNLTSFFTSYKQGGSSTFATLGVWSERTATGCIPSPSGKGHVQVDTPSPQTAFTPATDFTRRSVVYTQRRRTLGVGR
jgi:hypothetical protein